MRQLLRVLVLLSAWLICTGSQAAPVFTIGVQDYENYLPYSEVKNGEYRGLGRAILDLFARENGYVFDYVVLPLKRRDLLFVGGKLDFAFPDNPNWIPDLKKGKTIVYAPMLEFVDGVLVRPDDLRKGIDRIKKLGIPLGFTPYPYQQQIEAGTIKVEESGSYDKLYEKLVLKRVDGAYMNTRVAQYYWSHIQHWDEAPVRYDPDLPHAAGYHFLSSSKHPEIIEGFKQFMIENKAAIENLKKQYQFSP
jgi:hypothetical protein